MAEPTVSQRAWQSWFDAFVELSDAWPGTPCVPCPNSDHGCVRVTYLSDGDSTAGTAIVWCADCRQGIYLSRVTVPDGAERVPLGASDDELDAVVPPDVELLPPDPAQ